MTPLRIGKRVLDNDCRQAPARKAVTMRIVLLALIASMLTACASMGGRDPVQVTVADIESLPSEALELRMMVKLRVQNPNDAPVDYDGVYVKLDVMDKSFASGVSDAHGTIPRYGEAIVSVPVTVSMLRLALNAIDMATRTTPIGKVRYRMEGKLDGPLFGSTRFQATGELSLPGAGASP
jgi:LEA14-like dessication related protein